MLSKKEETIFRILDQEPNITVVEIAWKIQKKVDMTVDNIEYILSYLTHVKHVTKTTKEYRESYKLTQEWKQVIIDLLEYETARNEYRSIWSNFKKKLWLWKNKDKDKDIFIP